MPDTTFSDDVLDELYARFTDQVIKSRPRRTAAEIKESCAYYQNASELLDEHFKINGTEYDERLRGLLIHGTVFSMAPALLSMEDVNKIAKLFNEELHRMEKNQATSKK